MGSRRRPGGLQGLPPALAEDRVRRGTLASHRTALERPQPVRAPEAAGGLRYARRAGRLRMTPRRRPCTMRPRSGSRTPAGPRPSSATARAAMSGSGCQSSRWTMTAARSGSPGPTATASKRTTPASRKALPKACPECGSENLLADELIRHDSRVTEGDPNINLPTTWRARRSSGTRPSCWTSPARTARRCCGRAQGLSPHRDCAFRRCGQGRPGGRANVRPRWLRRAGLQEVAGAGVDGVLSSREKPGPGRDGPGPSRPSGDEGVSGCRHSLSSPSPLPPIPSSARLISSWARLPSPSLPHGRVVLRPSSGRRQGRASAAVRNMKKRHRLPLGLISPAIVAGGRLDLGVPAQPGGRGDVDLPGVQQVGDERAPEVMA